MATTEKRTSQHTPGPWTYTEKDNRGWHSIRSSDHRTVGEIICQLPWEAEANARLIAAAPEMLDMLDQAAQLFAYFAKTHGYETCAGMARRIGGLLATIEGGA